MKIFSAKRYLENSSKKYKQYLKAAEQYLARVNEKHKDCARTLTFAYRKPYEISRGNIFFYENLYTLLNTLKCLNLSQKARILEVGSGPGWITEILMSLDFEVDALEPSGDFIKVAQERITSFIAHHHLPDPPRVEFHQTTLEECELPKNSFDAILFIDSLHHIIDEERCFAKCFALLKEGGTLAIHEGAWVPGDMAMAKKIDDEMKLYGTLENPFTREYLDSLLHKYAFDQITRYYTVNGLFPSSQANRTVAQVASWAADEHSNIVTAIKPYSRFATTAAENSSGKSRAKIIIKKKHVDPKTRQISLELVLTNTGETIWLWGCQGKGKVTIALYALEQNGKSEAQYRNSLPGKDVFPGEEVEMKAKFTLPENYKKKKWQLDLIAEDLYWFLTPQDISI